MKIRNAERFTVWITGSNGAHNANGRKLVPVSETEFSILQLLKDTDHASVRPCVLFHKILLYTGLRRFFKKALDLNPILKYKRLSARYTVFCDSVYKPGREAGE